MEVQKDFEELFEFLNEKKVKYLIVGGYALAFHGAPRYTGDMDIYVKADSKNAKLIISALEKFGFGKLDISKSDFEKPDMVIQLGFPPVRVDFITSLTGVTWKEAYSKRLRGKYRGVYVNYIGRKQLIKNKKATGRKKDIADIEALGEKE
jgi:hypothetical protein